jgi:hypothetical protein
MTAVHATDAPDATVTASAEMSNDLSIREGTIHAFRVNLFLAVALLHKDDVYVHYGRIKNTNKKQKMHPYFTLLFLIPGILYAVSWNMYRTGNTNEKGADGLYYAAVAMQIVLVVASVFITRRTKLIK